MTQALIHWCSTARETRKTRAEESTPSLPPPSTASPSIAVREAAARTTPGPLAGLHARSATRVATTSAGGVPSSAERSFLRRDQPWRPTAEVSTRCTSPQSKKNKGQLLVNRLLVFWNHIQDVSGDKLKMGLNVRRQSPKKAVNDTKNASGLTRESSTPSVSATHQPLTTHSKTVKLCVVGGPKKHPQNLEPRHTHDESCAHSVRHQLAATVAKQCQQALGRRTREPAATVTTSMHQKTASLSTTKANSNNGRWNQDRNDSKLPMCLSSLKSSRSNARSKFLA